MKLKELKAKVTDLAKQRQVAAQIRSAVSDVIKKSKHRKIMKKREEWFGGTV